MIELRWEFSCIQRPKHKIYYMNVRISYSAEYTVVGIVVKTLRLYCLLNGHFYIFLNYPLPISLWLVGSTCATLKAFLPKEKNNGVLFWTTFPYFTVCLLSLNTCYLKVWLFYNAVSIDWLYLNNLALTLNI